MITTRVENNSLINLNNACKAILLLYICVLYAFYEVRIVVELIYIGLFFIYFITRRGKLTIYALWSLFFVAICFLSNLWTCDPVTSLKGTRSVLEVAIISNLLISFIDKVEKLYYLIECFIIAGMILVFKLIIVTPISAWGTERIGNFLYNANTMGIYLAISAICAMQMKKLNKSRVYNIMICAFFIVIVLTGSRKAFFLFVSGAGFLYLLNVKKKSRILIAIPAVVLLFIIGYQIIMNVPQFYVVLGSRVESLLNLVTHKGNIDASTVVRMNLIEIGTQLIRESPYLGYGIASYTQISYLGIYSHNNYIELLVGIGIIGTAIYYSIYFYSIFELVKLKNKDVNNIFLVIVPLLMFMEYGLVSYFGELYQIIIASSIVTINLFKGLNN